MTMTMNRLERDDDMDVHRIQEREIEKRRKV